MEDNVQITEWLFTDPHFKHPNLVLKGNRPEGYEELIQTDWVSKVLPQDRVFCLGDVCMKSQSESHTKYVVPMPGYKILIKGNHDNQKDSWYLAHGWDEVHDSLRLAMTVNGRHTRVLLSHFPQEDDGSFDINPHGHFHDDLHRTMKPEMIAIRSPKHRLLAMEAVDYKFVRLIDFLEGRVEQKGLPDYEAHIKQLGNQPVPAM
jgi:calcineurin-like phosphoesterase family protein